MAFAKTDLFDPRLNATAVLFKALSHPARLAILKYLAETKVCITGDISDDLLIEAIIHVLNKARLDKAYFTLVPVPSSRQSQRGRGRSFIVDLTKTISKHTGIAVNDCLQVSRRVSDQSGLTRVERISNMQGAFSLKSGSILRGDAIVIDDVVTTGATLQEAARALNSQGFHAFGSVCAVTACVAQPLR